MGVHKKYVRELTKEFLYQEYMLSKKSMKQIGKETGCSTSTFSGYINMLI